MHGHGLFTWTTGESYEGTVHKGSLTGEGRYAWPDGSHYNGMHSHSIVFIVTLCSDIAIGMDDLQVRCAMPCVTEREFTVRPRLGPCTRAHGRMACAMDRCGFLS